MTTGVVITGDGSSTLFHRETGEHYHSVYGAVTESVHVFIRNGLRLADPAADPLNVLEVGSGTGLNALLTLLETADQPRTVAYDAIEPFPPGREIIGQLQFPGILDNDRTRELFDRFHDSPENARRNLTPNFCLLKIASKLEDVTLMPGRYHLVYFDAFSPNVQPELWTPAIFRKICASMHPGGLLLTYCAKGSVARGMKETGFRVEKIAGPPGKRHMLRAIAGAIT